MIRGAIRGAAKLFDRIWNRASSRLATRIIAIATALGAGGMLLSASGIVPVKASSGHLDATHWFLNFTKERSLATHSLGLESPPLGEPWQVLKGAGHYESGCRPCHGSPEQRHPKIAQHMLPPPPYLPDRVGDFDNEELFYVIKHGIKLTGMPAWPSQERDDEVWAMVAFLRLLPKMSATEYRRLVDGDESGAAEDATPTELARAAPPSAKLAASCARCHGADGLGRGAAFPMLAGQSARYLAESLAAYADGRRHSGIMEPIAAGLSEDEMLSLGETFAKLDTRAPASPLAAANREGEEIAKRGIPSQDVPACAACHGPGGAPRNPLYPALAGQHADYLAMQLKLFKEERRGGTAYARIMSQAAAGLNEDQITKVARYYASVGRR